MYIFISNDVARQSATGLHVVFYVLCGLFVRLLACLIVFVVCLLVCLSGCLFVSFFVHVLLTRAVTRCMCTCPNLLFRVLCVKIVLVTEVWVIVVPF